MFARWGLVIAALALVAGCGSTTTSSQQPGTAPGPAPNTDAQQLQFTAKTVENESFSGQSLAGKRAVLWFWTPWCPTCQREAPDVAKVAQANPAVTFVGVAAQDQVTDSAHWSVSGGPAGRAVRPPWSPKNCAAC